MIRSGLEIVARNAQSSASAQMAEVQTDYERQMNEMRRTLIRASMQANQYENSKDQTFRMLFLNQDRNAEMIEALSENTEKLTQMVQQLQRRMAAQIEAGAQPQRIVNSTYQPSYPTRIAARPKGPSPIEINRMRMIRKQISELETQLEQMQPTKVRPATHLQPLYPEPTTLSPIFPKTYSSPQERSR